MNLLVTGATGEIGGSLLERLASRGRIRLLSRRPRPGAGGDVETVQGDLRDQASLSRACQGVETVLHMAAVTHTRRAEDYLAVNVAGTVNLIRAAEKAGIGRFVHLSTRAIGAAGGAYSLSKELAEQKVRESRLQWIILRPAEVYGSGGRDPILSLARSLQARSFVPIIGDGSYRLCPVHVDDVVQAIVMALERPAAIGNTYVLAGPEEMTYLELVERIEATLGLAPRRRLHVPAGLARRVIRLASSFGLGGYVPDQIPRLLLPKSSDNSAATRDLAFSPSNLEGHLRRMFAANHELER